MDDTRAIVAAYSWANLAWCTAQAIPLIIWPSLIASILGTGEYHHATATESYFARSLGFAILTLGLLTISLSGIIPLGSEFESQSDTSSPYASAVFLITSLHHASAAFYCYVRLIPEYQTGYLLGCAGSALLAAFGLWAFMFAGDSHMSRRTGADKRTSGWPFKNAEASKKNVPKRKGL